VGAEGGRGERSGRSGRARREREGEGEEAKRVTTTRVVNVEKRGGEEPSGKILGRPRGEREFASVGVRREAWSVRPSRSHPTALHREATLIADPLRATMATSVTTVAGNVTYVDGGWKNAARSIRWILAFLTLSPPSPPPAPPLPSGQPPPHPPAFASVRPLPSAGRT